MSNLNVIDIKSGNIAYHQDLWIVNGHIQKLTPHRDKLSKQDRVIDCSGKYVIPALWDMHAHTASFDWVPKLLIANGVLGIRELDGNGKLYHLQQRKNGVYKGLEFYCSGNTIEGDGPHGMDLGLDHIFAPEEGRQEVRRQKDLGFDFIKTRLGLSRETFFAIADECQKLNIPMAAHLSLSVTHEEAINAGVVSIEHTVALQEALKNKDELAHRIEKRDSTFFTSEGIFNVPKYYAQFLDSLNSHAYSKIPRITSSGNTWFCPTLVMWRGWAGNDTLSYHPDKNKYIQKDELESWYAINDTANPEEIVIPDDEYKEVASRLFNEILKVIKPMNDAGTHFLAGTDYITPFIYPGYDLHDELQLFVAAGLTPLEALQTATINPAIFLNRMHDLGTVEKGKIANLVLLDKNPLENIENTETIFMVIQHGNIYDKERITLILNSINN
ncbi:amidohydrolase family protein [Mangrovimonas sp. DI 80]|uniref:amidohydrolase family protein n=1 Tax=Mangrovimonas sp. DI 80 TaxID=1779330 RepID=UPI0015C57E64|nr:amidohydrolase family protein [Mangrovimonas sp. DI 80]